MAIIKLSGNAETDNGRFAMPADGAVGIYFTNNSKSKLRNNFAVGELLAEINGTLSPTVDYTTMKSNTGYLQTDVKETSEMTMFAIYEQPSSFTSSGAMIASTYRGDSSSFGAGLHTTSSGVFFIASQEQDSGTNTAGGRIVPADGWTLVVGRVEGTTNYIRNLTTGTINATTYVKRVLGDSPAKFRIGAGYDSAFNDSIKIMAVAVFDRALSDTEINNVAVVLRRYATKHGVSV